MPCPVSDKKKKKELPKYQPGWRKRYMIDLNTLTSKQDWLNKLEGITPEAYAGLRAALKEQKLI